MWKRLFVRKCSFCQKVLNIFFIYRISDFFDIEGVQIPITARQKQVNVGSLQRSSFTTGDPADATLAKPSAQKRNGLKILVIVSWITLRLATFQKNLLSSSRNNNERNDKKNQKIKKISIIIHSLRWISGSFPWSIL